MKKLLLLAGLVYYCAQVNAQTAVAPASDTVRTDATISNATVYFGYGAELTHNSKAKVDANTRIIVINQLSTKIDVSSLQISVPEDVALLSQRYSVYYPVVPPIAKTREVERLEDSITLVLKEIGRIDNLIVIDQEILTKTGLLIETTINTSGNKTAESPLN